MAATLPSIPDPRNASTGLLYTILVRIKTIIDTRILGVHGDDEVVVTASQLGVSTQDLTLVTAVKLTGTGTLQFKTRTVGIVSGIITVVNDETDWTNA